MTKNEIKKIEIINFNHQSTIWLSDLPHWKNIFIIKKGRKNRYFLEIEGNGHGAHIERYDFKNANFSKYDPASNRASDYFIDLGKINYDFIENFDKICKAKKFLEKYLGVI